MSPRKKNLAQAQEKSTRREQNSGSRATALVIHALQQHPAARRRHAHTIKGRDTYSRTARNSSIAPAPARRAFAQLIRATTAPLPPHPTRRSAGFYNNNRLCKNRAATTTVAHEVSLAIQLKRGEKQACAHAASYISIRGARGSIARESRCRLSLSLSLFPTQSSVSRGQSGAGSAGPKTCTRGGGISHARRCSYDSFFTGGALFNKAHHSARMRFMARLSFFFSSPTERCVQSSSLSVCYRQCRVIDFCDLRGIHVALGDAPHVYIL